MNNVWVCGDFHFCHNKEFIYKPRGFETVEEMNTILISNFNSVVNPEDEVYMLGDFMLGGADMLDAGLAIASQLNGHLHLVRGNHDTDKRWEAYKNLPNVVEMQNAIYISYQKHHFYLSHYPTFTGNLEKESLKQCLLNIHAHTHSKNKFYQDIPFMYCACFDAHNNFPVNMDDVIKDMYMKVKECKDEL